MNDLNLNQLSREDLELVARVNLIPFLVGESDTRIVDRIYKIMYHRNRKPNVSFLLSRESKEATIAALSKRADTQKMRAQVWHDTNPPPEGGNAA